MTQQKILHEIIVGLSKAAAGMRLIADEFDRGDIPVEMVGKALREMAQSMTQTVADISE